MLIKTFSLWIEQNENFRASGSTSISMTRVISPIVVWLHDWSRHQDQDAIGHKRELLLQPENFSFARNAPIHTSGYMRIRKFFKWITNNQNFIASESISIYITWIMSPSWYGFMIGPDNRIKMQLVTRDCFYRDPNPKVSEMPPNLEKLCRNYCISTLSTKLAEFLLFGLPAVFCCLIFSIIPRRQDFGVTFGFGRQSWKNWAVWKAGPFVWKESAWRSKLITNSLRTTQYLHIWNYCLFDNQAHWNLTSQSP